MLGIQELFFYNKLGPISAKKENKKRIKKSSNNLVIKSLCSSFSGKLYPYQLIKNLIGLTKNREL